MDIQQVEPRSTGEPQGSGSQINRRTVVAVGLAAAWTVPLIQLATAAPAAAASGTTLTISGLNAHYSGNVAKGNNAQLRLDITGKVDDVGPAKGTASAVTLTFFVPTAVSTTTPTITKIPKNWTAGTPTASPGGWTFTFTSAISPKSHLSFNTIQLGGGNLTGAAFLLTVTVQDAVAPISSGTNSVQVASHQN
jgi:hypothetical protein